MADDFQSNQAFTSAPQHSSPLRLSAYAEPSQANRVLWCLVEGDYRPFKVTSPLNFDIDNLKEVVHAKGIDTTKFSILPKNLVLWKLREAEPLEPDDTFARRVSSKISNLSEAATEPGPWKKLSVLFPQQPPQDCLHIIIQMSLNTGEWGSDDVTSYPLFSLSPDSSLWHRLPDSQKRPSPRAADNNDYPSKRSHMVLNPHRLRCLIEGESTPFTVTADDDLEVGDLKDVIKSKRGEGILKGIDPVTLELWKVNIDLETHNEDSLGLLKLGENVQGVEKLISWKLIRQYWSDKPPVEHLHIIVKVPPTPQLPPMRRGGSNPPLITPNISLRKTTVEGLYDVVMKKGLVYVRGTPGSGKTTLLELLHKHILERDPNAFVCVTWSWPPQNINLSGQTLDDYIRGIVPDLLQRTSPVFLLMDDAQESFGDSYLWNMFLKSVIDKPTGCYRVVVFCSYGSTSTPGKGSPESSPQGTPTDLARAARMTLWPRKAEGEEIKGILLDSEEFQEVVSQFSKELRIDQELSQKIFQLTGGHVGAVCELLRLILNKSKTRLRNGEVLTVNTYYEDFSLEYIMRNISGSFTRGLPRSKELEDRPDLSIMFRRLLESGRVTERDYEKAVQYCHRKGWIYAEDDGLESTLYYTFASPLHHTALSWRLQSKDYLPQFESPYTLSLQVLAKFKPSQMKLPIRRVGGGSTSPPEAQYQDEYYRCLLTVTCGNVLIAPEFASEQGAQVGGRIDFFIPSVKWGIEITRDGDRLKQHDYRFKPGGAYHKWLEDDDMTDYVLLNCCTSIPKVSHPDIPNLYHVVFNDAYTQVCVFNNKREQVWGPKVLQENHD